MVALLVHAVHDASTGLAYRQAVADRLTANPSDPDALFTHAAILAIEGRYRGAIEALQRLMEVSPDYPGAWAFRARLYDAMGEPFLARVCSFVHASFYV